MYDSLKSFRALPLHACLHRSLLALIYPFPFVVFSWFWDVACAPCGEKGRETTNQVALPHQGQTTASLYNRSDQADVCVWCRRGVVSESCARGGGCCIKRGNPLAAVTWTRSNVPMKLGHTLPCGSAATGFGLLQTLSFPQRYYCCRLVFITRIVFIVCTKDHQEPCSERPGPMAKLSQLIKCH
eukprot:753267-Rhodomonas_salina.6